MKKMLAPQAMRENSDWESFGTDNGGNERLNAGQDEWTK